MSLWYEGYLAFDLLPDASREVLDTLQYLTRTEDSDFENPPNHEFFTIQGWRSFLQIETAPSGLPGLFWRDFRRLLRYSHKGQEHYRHTLSFRRLMHDDVEYGQLWWQFLYWIAPHVETIGYAGYYRETYALHPNIIYLKDGKVFRAEVSVLPVGWYGETWDGDPTHSTPAWAH